MWLGVVYVLEIMCGVGAKQIVVVSDECLQVMCVCDVKQVRCGSQDWIYIYVVINPEVQRSCRDVSNIST